MFPTPEDIDRLMIYNWTELVEPHHEIWHLGDLGFFNETNHEFLKQLPGTKKLVRGNHDNKLSPQWLLDHGFEEIESPSVMFEGVEILFTHYPQKVLGKNQANIFGHVHNNPSDITMKHLNACVELWHYAPVHARFLAEKLVWSHKTNSNDFGRRTIKFRS